MSVAPLRKLARAGRSFGLTWRYGFNLAPTLSYKFDSSQLTGEASRVHRELDRNGIAITSADRLLKNSNLFSDLEAAVAALERERAAELEKKRADANSVSIGAKTFNVELLGSHPVLDLGSVWARFALQDSILNVANAYFGMFTRLRYYNVWHTFATESEARESQLWHFDREDHFILKVFVYFSDVDDGSGPFTYAAGSHLKKGLSRLPDHFVQGGVRRSNDTQMAAVVPQNLWVKATGKKGTIVFADTRGYHKGGLARTHDRLMYLCMFTSQASESEELFVPSRKLDSPSGKAESFAISRHLRR